MNAAMVRAGYARVLYAKAKRARVNVLHSFIFRFLIYFDCSLSI